MVDGWIGIGELSWGRAWRNGGIDELLGVFYSGAELGLVKLEDVRFTDHAAVIDCVEVIKFSHIIN